MNYGFIFIYIVKNPHLTNLKKLVDEFSSQMMIVEGKIEKLSNHYRIELEKKEFLNARVISLEDDLKKQNALTQILEDDNNRLGLNKFI